MYIDDGALQCGMRGDPKKGMDLTHHQFNRFGLEMHIGRGASTSKTKCTPKCPHPPGPGLSTLALRHSQQRAAAATIFQQAFCRTHAGILTTHQIVKQPAQSSNCLTNFLILGYRVTVASSHPTHWLEGDRTMSTHQEVHYVYTWQTPLPCYLHPSKIIINIPSWQTVHGCGARVGGTKTFKLFHF